MLCHPARSQVIQVMFISGPQERQISFECDCVELSAARNGFLDSIEGQWNRGSSEPSSNAGYRIRYKEGYFPIPPADTLQDLRTEIMLMLDDCGIEVEAQHHEVATAGQCEIDMRYAPLLQTADNLLKYKYIVKNVAAAHGKTATFMPKPLWNDNGSGLHLHLSLSLIHI